jgi:hypothetical protein
VYYTSGNALSGGYAMYRFTIYLWISVLLSVTSVALSDDAQSLVPGDRAGGISNGSEDSVLEFSSWFDLTETLSGSDIKNIHIEVASMPGTGTKVFGIGKGGSGKRRPKGLSAAGFGGCKLGTGYDANWYITGERYVYGPGLGIHFGAEYTMLYSDKWCGDGWYRPNGSQYYENKNHFHIPHPSDYGYEYWEWYNVVFSYDSMPSGMSSEEGDWTAKWWDDGSNNCTKTYTVMYDLSDHKMCADVQGSSPYDPIDVRNVFDPDDEKCYSWMRFDNYALNWSPDVKWRWFGPEGFYSENEYDIPDPGSGSWHTWYKTWCSISIAGSYPATHPGAWHVDVYVKDYQGNYEHKFTENFTITCDPPVITDHPDSQTVCEGASVQFCVTATGTAPLSYQWKKDGGNIPGATTSCYTINPVSSGDAGNYTCVVSNPCDSVESNAAALTVNTASIITDHPDSQTVCEGASVQFCVTATGTAPLSYQWKKDGGNITGATSSCYTINPVSSGDAGNYTCVVTNPCGSVESNAATLIVNTAPVITQHPQNVAVFMGQDAMFTVEATGTAPLHYQWKKNGLDVGDDSASLTLYNVQLGDDGSEITCDVNNVCGTVTSGLAILTVNPILCTVTVSAGPNGSVDPNGVVDVNFGADKPFTATPNVGYTVDKWYLDANTVQVGNTAYSLFNIQSDHTVHVTFKLSSAIIYVDANAPGGANNGTSWADAYIHLQDALSFAANSGGDVNEIRVAQGAYTPDQGVSIMPGDRTATFQLINGVTIKGGYAGFGEPDPNACDVELYETILSGDLDSNDVDVNDPCDLLTEPSRAENSYHVVSGSGIDANGVLDGFTITGGNADACSIPLGAGGGMFIRGGGSPTVVGCMFIENSATYGGGMFNGEGCNPSLIGCTLLRNAAAQQAGGMHNWIECSPLLASCTFRDNFSVYLGGGLYDINDSNPFVETCTFISNSAGDSLGGGMYNYDSSPTVTNCLFVSNKAADGGGIANQGASMVTITNCILWDNSAQTGAQIYNGGISLEAVGYCNVQGGWLGTGNIDVDPCFVDPCDGDYHLKSEYGRWDSNSEEWVYDYVTSECIDAGDPNSDWTAELWPHGKRINIGVYGGTPEASMSSSDLGNIADLNNDGIVNFGDVAIFALVWDVEQVLLAEDFDRNGLMDYNDLAILALHWLEVEPVKLYDFALDTDPGWSIEGEWEFGQPTGGGGANGNPDPNEGCTGTNVYGVNLDGDYRTAVGGPYYLTAGPLDCSGYDNIVLKLARWLNTDEPDYVASEVEVSNNGTDWYIVWEHVGSLPITDNSWQIMEYDIGAVADGQVTVYIRWSYEILDSQANPYSGWNMDDIQLWGNPW